MSNTTTSKSIKIISTHATLSEAVAAAGIDLSYNEASAKAKIRDTEREHRGCKSGAAFVTAEGVFYLYTCDITLLNKFEPFHSVLDDGNFAAVTIGDGEIVFSDRIIPKTAASRKVIATIGCIVG